MVKNLKNKDVFQKIIIIRNMVEQRRFKGGMMYALNKNLTELSNKYEPCQKTVNEISQKYVEQKEKELESAQSEESKQKIEEKYLKYLEGDEEIKEVLEMEVEVELRAVPLDTINGYDFNFEEMQALDCMIEE